MGFYEFKKSDALEFARMFGAETKYRGDELQFMFCPYCRGGKNKDKGTFSINMTSGRFKCLRSSCGAQGNMVTLAKDFNFSLGDATDAYYGRGKKFRTFRQKEKPVSKSAAISYLESRGISERVTALYNITVQSDHENILVFPFYDENDTLQFVKYRKIDFDKSRDKNKEWCERSCKPILFGMSQCNFENKTLVLTEGQIDSMSVAESGIENAVSVPTGSKGFTWIPYCWDFLARFDNLIVFGDYENGSITLLDEMKERFHGTIKHVRVQDYRDCKDANELLQKYGKQAVADAVRNAVQIENPHIKRLSDVKRVDLSKLEKVTTGIYALDKLLGGFYFGQLVLITGERGHGKSTLVSQFGTFAVKSGYSVFFYSGELVDWYFKSWIEFQIAGRRAINKLVSTIGYESYSVKGEVIPQMEQWYGEKIYIYDNRILEEGQQEEELLIKTLETAIRQYGCRVLVIDNLMTAIPDDVRSDLYRMQTQFVRRLTLIAKHYNVLIFLIAHPRKATGTKFDNDDIAGSSNVTNFSDVVMKYGKPEKNDDPDTKDRVLTVYKNRLTGRTDRKGIPLYFQECSKRISEHDGIFDWELGWEHINLDAEDDDSDLERMLGVDD